MSAITDNNDEPLFTDTFEHRVFTLKGVEIDVIETNGNIWLSAAEALRLMGFSPHKSGGYGRTLRRLSHPDKVKIIDTPFRYQDGRRNRGSFISPRAVLQFADAKTQGRNPIATNAFIEWMQAVVMPNSEDPLVRSPAVKPTVQMGPVFRAVVIAENEDEQGRELDPVRPRGAYQGLLCVSPMSSDEVEFCLCPKKHHGLGMCWCGGRGGIRSEMKVVDFPCNDDGVIDHGDDFSFKSVSDGQRRLHRGPRLKIAANF